MADPHRDRRRRELAALLARPDVREAIERFGTPLLLLEPERVRAQYRRLTSAFPGVRFHYAVKAFADPAVIAVLRDEACCFDVASPEEAELISAAGVDPRRVICTHPIKTPAEIRGACAGGIRTFVVDNAAELAKFVGLAADVRVLVRLAYPNASAGCDLSAKFGVDRIGAQRLVEQSLGQGTAVAGFSFHVGSQLDDPRPFRAATQRTLDLMDTLQRRLPVRFDTLDIGGGIPASYDHGAIELERVAEAVMPVLAERAGGLDVIAEPGRIMVADAMTLVTRVVGVADRPDGRWLYLDDGLYGSYSNVLTEHVHPLVLAENEVRGAEPGERATLAGPTCDSTDVIGRGMPVPDGLAIGDLVLSPTMGAYTTVTASRFNGRPFTRVVVVGGESAQSAPGPKPASRARRPASERSRTRSLVSTTAT